MKTTFTTGFCTECQAKTPHWYDRVFYAFFCTTCDGRARKAYKDAK